MLLDSDEVFPPEGPDTCAVGFDDNSGGDADTSIVFAELSTVLPRVGGETDRQVTLLLLFLSAQVLSSDPKALTTLDLLQQRCEDLGKSGRWQDWAYDGTLLYLEKHVPPSPRSLALLELARGVERMAVRHRKDGPPPAIPAAVFDRLRSALESGQGRVIR